MNFQISELLKYSKPTDLKLFFFLIFSSIFKPIQLVWFTDFVSEFQIVSFYVLSNEFQNIPTN